MIKIKDLENLDWQDADKYWQDSFGITQICYVASEGYIDDSEVEYLEQLVERTKYSVIWDSGDCFLAY